ncbi:probable root meristem growth factor 8 isoform X2 [Vitis riparia]|uniref:probable root meristem growth factor 8 isoform X2 n=1 Tax=Vitis riparia TaxID=96939 RepID=UPI00155B01D5|nr:probable root meristem growth factor 8 isoform X2 [Vitis riparia]
MELIVITMLCIGLLILLTPCASLQIQLQPWHGQAHDDLISQHLGDAYDLQQHSFSKMPRKLRLIQVKRDGEKDSMSQHHKKKADFSGKPCDKEPGLRRGRGGTMKEWMEGADMSQFFTMDYSHVRRRRPIHNKSVPVGP